MPSSAPRHRPMPKLAPRHEVQGAVEKYGQGRGGRPWRRKREQVAHRAGFVCEGCGALTILMHGFCDHITPQAESGTDEMNNLQWLCRSCHEVKSKAEQARGTRRRGAARS